MMIRSRDVPRDNANAILHHVALLAECKTIYSILGNCGFLYILEIQRDLNLLNANVDDKIPGILSSNFNLVNFK